MMTLKYDRELVESFSILSKNIEQRRATAVKKFFAKYENCSENDEIVDLRTLKVLGAKKLRTRTLWKAAPHTVPYGITKEGAKKLRTRTLWKAAPHTVPYGMTKEDEKHLKIIRDKIKKGGRIRNSGAEFDTSSFGSRVLGMKIRNTRSEADGLDRDVKGKKRPSNETELHSKCTPGDKGSLLKPVRRINPIKLNVTQLNLDQDGLSKKRPSNHSERTPEDKGSLLKVVRNINPMHVRKLNDSLDHIPLALECISPINPLTPVGLRYSPKRLPTTLDKIPIALECISPFCRLTPVERAGTSKHLRRPLFERKKNSSLNGKLDNTPIHSKSTFCVRLREEKQF